MTGLLTKKELAAHLRVSVRTVTNMVKDGEISVTRLRRSVRFDLAEVKADLAKRKVKRRVA